ncbi:MAG: hypothetical protein JXA21_23535 [Anaerolineae bacterium]|nr:hypothetical protein [Anaerolineae bacterium]
MGHYLAWVIWLAALLGAISLTRNPLYLVLLLLETLLVLAHLRRDDALPATPLPVPIKPLHFAGFAILAGTVINALTTHFGETVLFRLPAGIPLLGGPVTAEGAAYGALNGLALAALFAAFMTLNFAVSARDMVRWIPKAFYPVALVISIAVTFAPATLCQVSETQAVRGHRMRGLRDWLPLFMPLLVGGLEHAFQLAEAMTARGFASSGAIRPAQALADRLILLAAPVLLLAGGLLRLLWGQATLGLALILSSVGLFAWRLYRAGRGIKHTSYRQTPWTFQDGVGTAGALAALLALIFLGVDTRAFTPYLALTLPGFSPAVGALSLGLLAPLLYGPEQEAIRE